VGGKRVVDGARNGAKGGLVQDEMDALEGAAAVFEAADVAAEEFETAPLLRRDGGADLIEILAVAGGEVIQAGDALAGFEEGFKKIGANKAGNAGDQPELAVGFQAEFWYHREVSCELLREKMGSFCKKLAILDVPTFLML
jgi:hypothetical protein